MPLKLSHIVCVSLTLCFCILTQKLEAQDKSIQYDSIRMYLSLDSTTGPYDYFGSTLESTQGWFISTSSKRRHETKLNVEFLKIDVKSGNLIDSNIISLDGLVKSDIQLSTTSNDSFYFIYIALDSVGQDSTVHTTTGIQVFRLSPQDQWTKHQFISIPFTTFSQYLRFSLECDKENLVVGLPNRDSTGSKTLKNVGLVQIYNLKNNRWQLVHRIRPPQSLESDQFGYSVSLHQNILLVSAPYHKYGDTTGVVYLFKQNNEGEWQVREELRCPSSEYHEFFGDIVLISEGGIFITSRRSLYVPSYHEIHYRNLDSSSEFKSKEVNSHGVNYAQVFDLQFKNHTLYISLNSGNLIRGDDPLNSNLKFGMVIYVLEHDSLKITGSVLDNEQYGRNVIVVDSGKHLMMNHYYSSILTEDSVIISNVGSLVLLKKQECITSYNTITSSICDQYPAPSGFTTWTQSGSYDDLVFNSAGCLEHLNFNLNFKYSSTHTIDTTICGNYMMPSKKRVIQIPGLYWDTIPNSVGCDSLITINLESINTDASYRKEDGILVAENTRYAQYQWIDCISNTAIPGATDTIFHPLKPGFYALEVTDGVCPNRSACVEIREEELPETTLVYKVFPNPNNGHCSINFSRIQEDVEIQIFTVQGQLIEHFKRTSTTNIQVNLPSAGIYYIRVNSSNLEDQIFKVVSY
ncbi:T9SS type A sorting domain-containing protein [bacterium]|nr:T9SS type A sorting domain-containing protein [bacterium]